VNKILIKQCLLFKGDSSKSQLSKTDLYWLSRIKILLSDYDLDG
jgi:hypothetical protein